MSRFKTFLKAVESEEPADFIQAVEDHLNKVEGANLDELLEAAPQKEWPTLCAGLKQQAERGRVLLQCGGEHQEQQAAGELQEDTSAREEAGRRSGVEDGAAGARELGFSVLYGVAVVARALLRNGNGTPPTALQAAAQLLHDEALLAVPDLLALQEEVARLCLEWWQAEAPGREQLSPQTVPYLLLAALQQGTGAAVRRCHAMRTALALFDFDDASAADLKRLLLQAAFAPAFLKCTEGRRFLSYLFQLQPAFVRELTAIIKNQIPAGKKSVLDAYGDVLFRAWTHCAGACALELQQHCIQGLMEAAILASSPAMAANLRRVLAGFHSQKHHASVDALLLELYEPILFRRLNAPNPEVRRNALALFLDAFPLRDPKESNEDTDRRLSEQFGLLTRALKDEVPALRAAAVQGVSRVLDEFWELIPAAVTAGYVKALAGELAFDTASPAVRLAVVEGLAELVQNALAQPLLKAVLPQLEPLLYDSSARVRTAFADLLLALQGLQGLRWHDVVGVEKLLQVLAADVPAVSQRIQRLLLPSYLPDLESGPALVAALLRIKPAAGAAFCQYLVGAYKPPTASGAAVAPVGDMAVHVDMVVELVGDIKAHLLETPLAAVAPPARGSKTDGEGRGKARSKRKKGQPQLDKEKPEDDQEVVETAESWAAIMEGLAALACGLAAQAAVGAVHMSYMSNLLLSGDLVQLLQRCPTSGARCAVMAVAAAAPHLDAAAEVRGRCLKQLLSSGYPDGGSELSQELRGAVACITAGLSSQQRLFEAVARALHADKHVVASLHQHCDHGGHAEAVLAELPRARTTSKSVRIKAVKKQEGRSGGPSCSTGKIDASLACHDCGSRAREVDMLLCDFCNLAFHLDCLEPPLDGVPEGDWFCSVCEAEMANGMSPGMAICVLGLLLEQDGQRGVLLRSGLLPQLLACMDTLVGERLAAIKIALADNTGVSLEEGGVLAPQAIFVFLKASLHLSLSDATIARPADADPGTRDAAQSSLQRALECMQQALEWAASLLQQLGRVDIDDLLHAVGARRGSVAKRSKSSKVKAAAADVGAPLVGPAVVLREAFESVLTIVALLGEAARVRILTWTIRPSALANAQGAASVATSFLALLNSMADGISAGTTADAEDALAAAVGLAARLVRSLASCMCPDALGNGGTGRDLDAEDWDSGEAGGAVEGRIDAVTTLADVVVALLQMVCSDGTGITAAALKPHLPGLVAAVVEATDSSSCEAASATGSRWLQPVALLLGSQFVCDDLPSSTPGDYRCTAGADENTHSNAAGTGQLDTGNRSRMLDGGTAAKGPVAFARCACEQALVKQLVAGAQLVKVAEQAAGQAAQAAAAAWEAGSSRESLGGLVLCELLGFKGVDARGRCKAGAGRYAAAIEHLRRLQRPPGGQLNDQAMAALVRHKVDALFPPAPRVTFSMD